MNNDEWLNDRVKYLKGLKSKSEQQELLVLLAEKTNRTTQDDMFGDNYLVRFDDNYLVRLTDM